MKIVFLLFAALTFSTTMAELLLRNYTHEGDDLLGFLSVPVNASADSPIPAIVIVPDWDGVNDYEKLRAEMISTELHYVSFAADIYGANLHEVTNMTQRSELAGFYRDNPELFAGRIQAAVELVRTLEEVDAENVAIIGYCFGGTGVLTYGLLAFNDVKAIVSFHGGLSAIPDAGDPVTPKILVLSGGDDDASTDIRDLEMTLDIANADWEITRYSGVEHAFTVFDDERYNKWADMRSWDSMKEFLADAFGFISFKSEQPESANVVNVDYTDVDGTELRGYLAKPSDEWQPQYATVVLLPDWDGNNMYEMERATLLAELGYVGFAADIYGADLQANLTIDERVQLAGLYRGNVTLFVQRISRAIELVKTFDFVDTSNIAVIGYCFGGTGVIQLAFSGNVDVKAVVSFHGGLTNLTDPTTSIAPYTLILSVGDDDAHGNQTELEAALNAGNATWEITRYSGVVHGFTDWNSDGYSLQADNRSWKSMLTSFAELMPVPVHAEKTQAPLLDVPSASPVVSMKGSNYPLPTSMDGARQPSAMPKVLSLAPSKQYAPNVSPVYSPSTLVQDTEDRGVSSEVLLAIIVSVAFIISVVLVAALILHTRKQRQPESTHLNIALGNEYSSGVAASVVSVSATPLTTRENDPIPEVRRKESNPLGGKRLPEYKDQCQPAAVVPNDAVSDNDHIPVVSARLDVTHETTDRV